MKRLSRTTAIRLLREIKRDFADAIQNEYEHRAQRCAECVTPGACCLDEHFVNVHISRLEAEAILERLRGLPPEKSLEIESRIERAVNRYGLDTSGDTFEKTYACPLFEKGSGCLVHGSEKPLPCIAHACYERQEDMPPDGLLAERETTVDELNKRVFGGHQRWLPIPLALKKFRRSSS